MGEILEQIYHGTLRPMEKEYVGDPKYIELRKQLEAKRTMIAKKLDKEEVDTLEEILSIRIQMDCFCDMHEFINGFKLGIQLMVEALTNSE